MTDRELMQMALDALSMAVKPKKGKVYAFEFQPIDCDAMYLKAIEVLRARLAQPEQPQIVWIDNKQTGNFLNIAPPQREWVGLTDEEIESTWQRNLFETYIRKGDVQTLGRAIEAKLKEKNEKL